MRLLSSLISPSCIVCHKPWEWLCKDCQKILKAHEDICPICHHHSPAGKVCPSCELNHKPNFDGITIAFKNTPPIKSLIYKFKAAHQKDVGRFFADFLKREILRNQFLKKPYAITYVPTHWSKNLFARGFSPPQIIATHLAKKLDAPLIHICKKVKNTPSQMRLSKRERQLNVKNAFGLNKLQVPKGIKSIVVVDDLTTTWATLNEVAWCIKSHLKNIQVRGLAIARSA